jgi:hypothetical protein
VQDFIHTLHHRPSLPHRALIQLLHRPPPQRRDHQLAYGDAVSVFSFYVFWGLPCLAPLLALDPGPLQSTRCMHQEQPQTFASNAYVYSFPCLDMLHCIILMLKTCKIQKMQIQECRHESGHHIISRTRTTCNTRIRGTSPKKQKGGMACFQMHRHKRWRVSKCTPCSYPPLPRPPLPGFPALLLFVVPFLTGQWLNSYFSALFQNPYSCLCAYCQHAPIGFFRLVLPPSNRAHACAHTHARTHTPSLTHALTKCTHTHTHTHTLSLSLSLSLSHARKEKEGKAAGV